MKTKLNIILLADDRHPASAVRDHIDALVTHSRHDVHVVNPIANPLYPKWPIRCADVLAIHYSIYVLYDWFLPARFRKLVTEFPGPKVQFIQDEYRLVHPLCEVIADLGIDAIFTLVRPDLVEQAYDHPRLRNIEKVSVLPGYVPNHLYDRTVPPVAERPIDIGYRSRRLPYWLGALGQDKVRIAQAVQRLAPAYGLRCDISVEESARLYGEKWFSFLASCKAVLGTEGGASIWDYDGSAQRAAEAYLARHPDAGFEEVWQAVLAPFEGNLMYNTMSPRIFEAAALRTPMIMFPGWYSGVVEPERHYIVLEKDFSNFSDVVSRLRDTAYLQDLADRVHADLVASGKYSGRAFAAIVDDVIDRVVRRRAQQPLRATTGGRRPTASRFGLPVGVESGKLWHGARLGRTLRALLFRALGESGKLWHAARSAFDRTVPRAIRATQVAFNSTHMLLCVGHRIVRAISNVLYLPFLAALFVRRLVAALFLPGRTMGDRLLEVARLLGSVPSYLSSWWRIGRPAQIVIALLFHIAAYGLLCLVWGVRLLRTLAQTGIDDRRSPATRLAAIARRLRKFRSFPRVYRRLKRTKKSRLVSSAQPDIKRTPAQ